MLLCHGVEHGNGTMIMFDQAVDVEIIVRVQMNKNGQVLTLEDQFDNKVYFCTHLRS